jgi:hypothetical protein
MSRISATQFGEICDGVWRDRADVLSGRGSLDDEAALVRAVYWRLRKAGADPDQSIDDHSSLLGELVRRCRDDAAPVGRRELPKPVETGRARP